MAPCSPPMTSMHLPRRALVVLLLVLLLVRNDGVAAFPTGAGSCRWGGVMHDEYSATPGDGGYSITVAGGRLIAGRAADVVVEGAAAFKGLLLFAEQGGKPLGSWEGLTLSGADHDDDFQLKDDCPWVATHTHKRSRVNPRSRDALRWAPPGDLVAGEEVVFKATVLVSYSRFHNIRLAVPLDGGVAKEDQQQPKLTDKQPKAALAEGKPTVVKAASAPSCGKSVLGYACAVAVDGDGGGIAFHWSIDQASRQLSAAVQAKTSGWLGLSVVREPHGMVPADAIIGWATTEGVAHIKPYRIEGFKRTDVIEDTSQKLTEAGVSEEAVRGAGTITTIQFRRPLAYGGSQGPIHVTKDTHFNWAVGSADALEIHERRGSFSINLGAAMSSDDLALVKEAEQEVGQGGKTRLNVRAIKTRNRILHAWGMGIAWLLLMPVGTLAARHLKGRGGALWFEAHRAVQVAGVVLALLALQRVWSLNSSLNAPLRHGTIGIIAMLLLSFQPMNAWLRPDKSAARRPAWRRLHHFTGRAALVLGVVNVYIGLCVIDIKEKVRIYPYVVLFAATVTALGIAAIALELRRISSHKRKLPLRTV
eukprot:jgi/Chlat1/1800/Chrsp135S02129